MDDYLSSPGECVPEDFKPSVSKGEGGSPGPSDAVDTDLISGLVVPEGKGDKGPAVSPAKGKASFSSVVDLAEGQTVPNVEKERD